MGKQRAAMTRYLGFDLETTGVSSFLDSPVSYGFVERFEEGRLFATWIEEGYVNPGCAIPEGASAIHGITDDMVADACPLAEAVETIAERLTSWWREGGVVVGMNIGYDLTMVDSLCRRLATKTLAERGVVGPVMDVLVLDRHYDKWRKGSRKLSDLCAHYGVELGNAHSAGADAEASLFVFERIMEKYPEAAIIPHTAINTSLRHWYQEWLRSFSSYLERKGEDPIEMGRYEWPIHADL